MLFVGFDPGGRDAFGWAVLSAQDDGVKFSASGTCSSAPEALQATLRQCGRKVPKAFGVDAPLYWVLEGDRASDRAIRNAVCRAGGSGGTVSAVNSLRGACLAQGLLISHLGREAWPSALLTEAHPKALRRVSAEAVEFESSLDVPVESDHESDAVLAAFAAHQLFKKSDGWHDLLLCNRSSENRFFPLGRTVHYWFPVQANRDGVGVRD